jgi:ankyrin repeat protein
MGRMAHVVATLMLQAVLQVRCIEVAAILLDAGADVHARDKDGRTPLQRALPAGNTEVAKYLRQKGGVE